MFFAVGRAWARRTSANRAVRRNAAPRPWHRRPSGALKLCRIFGDAGDVVVAPVAFRVDLMVPSVTRCRTVRGPSGRVGHPRLHRDTACAVFGQHGLHPRPELTRTPPNRPKIVRKRDENSAQWHGRRSRARCRRGSVARRPSRSERRKAPVMRVSLFTLTGLALAVTACSSTAGLRARRQVAGPRPGRPRRLVFKSTKDAFASGCRSTMRATRPAP